MFFTHKINPLKNKKKLLSTLLASSLCATTLIPNVVNVSYAVLLGSKSETYNGNIYTNNVETLAQSFISQWKSQTTPITLYYYGPYSGTVISTDERNEVLSEVFIKAGELSLNDATLYTGGDYIKYYWTSSRFGIIYPQDKFNFITFKVGKTDNNDYLSETKFQLQEAEIQQAIDNFIKTNNLTTKSNYEKAYAIFDYIAHGMKFTGENGEVYELLKTKEGNSHAMSLLAYRIFRTLGMNDVRIVTGTRKINPNSVVYGLIVNLDGKYYMMDYAYESVYNEELGLKDKFFAIGTDSVYAIDLDEEFTDESFANKYPISKSSYQSSSTTPSNTPSTTPSNSSSSSSSSGSSSTKPSTTPSSSSSASSSPSNTTPSASASSGSTSTTPSKNPSSGSSSSGASNTSSTKPSSSTSSSGSTSSKPSSGTSSAASSSSSSSSNSSSSTSSSSNPSTSNPSGSTSSSSSPSTTPSDGSSSDVEKKYSFTVSNKLTGNQYSINDKFDYVITISNCTGTYIAISGANTTTITANVQKEISLGHYESLTILDIPQNATITIRQKSSTVNGRTYSTPTYTVNGTKKTNGLINEIISITQDTIVSYTNDKTASVPTGVTTKIVPFAIIGVSAIVGFVFIVLKKKTK